MVGETLILENTLASELKKIVAAIYDLTEQDKGLKELVCKFLSQASPSDAAKLVYDNFASPQIVPMQITDDPPRVRVFKENGAIKLANTVYFKLFDMETSSGTGDHVKATTVINFNTGHAVADYESS